MAKYVVYIGPDTYTLKAGSIAAIRKLLNKAMPKRKPNRLDDVRYNFMWGKYNYSELRGAHIMHINTWFKAHEIKKRKGKWKWDL